MIAMLSHDGWIVRFSAGKEGQQRGLVPAQSSNHCILLHWQSSDSEAPYMILRFRAPVCQELPSQPKIKAIRMLHK